MRSLFICLLSAAAVAACNGGSSESPPPGPGPEPSPSAPTAATNGSFLLTGSETSINGVPVPPPPDDAANAGAAGIDTNGNGVRDDVDRLVAKVYGSDPAAYSGAMKLAKRVQSILAPESMDRSTVQSLLSSGVEEARCLSQSHFSGDLAAAARANQIVMAATLNLPDRIRRYSERLRLVSPVIDLDFQKACS